MDCCTYPNRSGFNLQEFYYDFESNFIIVKYIYDDNNYYPVIYAVKFDEELGNDGDIYKYFNWNLDNDNRVLEEVSSDSTNIDITAKTVLNERAVSIHYEDINRSFLGLQLTSDPNYDSYLQGGAINSYCGVIYSINGDFVGNSLNSQTYSWFADAFGGAIYNYADAICDNSSIIGNIVSNFIGNSAIASVEKGGGATAKGGAIYNSSNATETTEYNATIGNITGDFIGNYVSSSSYGETHGGAIYNDNYASIDDITGDFIGNYATSGSYGETHGGAIYNDNYASIGNIIGDFIDNYVTSGLYGENNGGAIYNDNYASIGNIIGDFIGNYLTYYDGKGGAIYNDNNASIGDITGDFVDNYAICYGGAIYNNATIGDITGDFVGNYADCYNSANISYGGAIYNDDNAWISAIIGNFIDNHACNNHFSGWSSGGAIYNMGTIENIIGDFITNYVLTTLASYGGAILNEGEIWNITGDFIGNRAVVYKYELAISYARGGAINNNATIGNITGDFIGNYVNATKYVQTDQIIASGGAIENSGTIDKITGSFINNYAYVYNISDTFEGGEASASGGAISGDIGFIEGDFIGNYAEVNVNSSYARAYGGAINGAASISGSFIGNYVAAYGYGGDNTFAKGAAIYSFGNNYGIYTTQKDIYITGNYEKTVINGESVVEYTAIYNSSGYDGYGTLLKSVLHINAYDSNKIVINDAIYGEYSDDKYSNENQIININNGLSSNDIILDMPDGSTFSTVEINNEIINHTINVYAGELILGYFEGTTLGEALNLIGYNAEEIGIDGSIVVPAATAYLNNSDLNIYAGAIVYTKADYLGASNEISNDGILNLNGGTLSSTITGSGTLNIVEDIDVSLSSKMFGGVIIDNKITGIDSLDFNISFDALENDFANIFGSTISIYGDNVDVNVNFEIVGDTPYEYTIEGNQITIGNSATFNTTTAEYSAVKAQTGEIDLTITRGTVELFENQNLNIITSQNDAKATFVGSVLEVNTLDGNLDITSDNANIYEIINESHINLYAGDLNVEQIKDNSTINVMGGTLNTDLAISIGDTQTSEINKATSGSINSTSQITFDNANITLDAYARLYLYTPTININGENTINGSNSDSTLIFYGTGEIGKNSTLTANVELMLGYSLSIYGRLNSNNFIYSIDYSNSILFCFYEGSSLSLGDSISTLTIGTKTINFEEGASIIMKIDGTNGAGLEGGHDKIIFGTELANHTNVYMSGYVDLQISNIEKWDWSDVEIIEGKITKSFEFDLFDFSYNSNFDGTSLSIVLSGYDAHAWDVSILGGVYNEEINAYEIPFSEDIDFLTITVSGTMIPEPSTYAMIFGALALGFAYCRKCK